MNAEMKIKKPLKNTTIHFKVTAEDYDKLETISEADGTNISIVCRNAVAQYIKERMPEKHKND